MSIPAPKTSSIDLSPPQGDQQLYGPPCQVPKVSIVVQLQYKMDASRIGSRNVYWHAFPKVLPLCNQTKMGCSERMQ